MEQKKIDFELLSLFKQILDDNEYTVLDKVKDKINDDIPEPQKRKIIINNVVDGSAVLDTAALKDAIRGIITLQNTKTSNEIISKVGDVKSCENHSDFITFVEDGKKNIIIGDLHDDMNSFNKILEAIKFKEKFDELNLVFLGDYVDRGRDTINLINKIIFLKYLLPNNIHLLRGNHELYRVDENGDYFSPMQGAAPGGYHFDTLTFLVNSDSETNKAFVKENGIDKELIELYASFFESMPTVALFNFENIKICAVHGGLPRPNLNSENFFGSKEFDNFNSLLDEHTKDSVGITQKINMIWSDPYDGYPEGFRNSSEVRFSFSQEQFEAFCEKYDIDLMLRAHEVQENGYKTYFDERLISVFSSGGRDKEDADITNERSYYENVSPNILKLETQKLASINIDFSNNITNSVEEWFEYESIKQNRESTKNQPKKIVAKVGIHRMEKINSSEGVIQIVDMYDAKNRKIIISKGEIVKFNHEMLGQFFGVHKNICFEIDHKNKRIKNLSEIEIMIGINGAILQKNDSVKLQDDTLVSLKSGANLRVII